MDMTLLQGGIYQGILETGLHLADTPEAEGGWKEYLSEDLYIEDDMLRAQTALMLENAKRWMASKCRKRVDGKGRFVIDEATRSATVGGFADYIFPIIRAAFPSNPINDLVSVQPTTRRVATIVYWNWILGTTKGSYSQGQRLFDANTGWQDGGQNYSNEVISGERFATVNNATTTGTLVYNDGGGVRPGTVRLSLPTTGSGTVVLADDGQGGFVQASGTSVTISAGTINYATGAWSITLGGLETFTTAGGTANYRWDSESSKMLPEVDVQITTSTAETERRALRLNYSQEAMQDIMAEFGTSLEPQLVQGCAESINVEIARQVISELWACTPASAANSFNIKTPSGISQQEHFRDLIYVLNQASNSIWSATQKGYGNWLVCDLGAANLIESLPSTLFQRAPRPPSVQGVHYIGTLAGQYRVYKDLHLDKQPNSSAVGNMLMGFKGTDFYEAGYVWAPQQLLYSTQSLTTADFMTQRGIASRYATKVVNPQMFTRIALTNA
tara:strand:+ start:539 stop:2041 length:1503 start_codon:yes stop_codon:yes gene_type:complete